MPVLPFAVHISDGVLAAPVLAAGFILAALLAAFAAWRVREDEVPRVALLTAAFFVASSIHVKLGPASSVHLLLNGLVGVTLGRRAPLAILVGVTLQALLIPHGGVSTIGVNACTETLPALLAWLLFAGLSRASDARPWVRSLLVGSAAAVWGWCLLFGVGVLLTGRLGEMFGLSGKAGVQLRVDDLSPALAVALHPAALAGLTLFAAACVFAERRTSAAPGFPRGALVGTVAVLCTSMLSCAVLILGAAAPVREVVPLVFVAHLPVALVEGMIVGCVVAFLVRVKPEMLNPSPRPAGPSAQPPPRSAEEEQGAVGSTGEGRLLPCSPLSASGRGGVFLLAALGLLASASPALAHNLEADYTVNRDRREVTVTCLYETGDPPKKGAKVVVKRADGSVLTEGTTDEKGQFVFRYEKAEPLIVRVTEVGHVGQALVKKADLEVPADTTEPEPKQGSRWRDLALGVALLLAVAAFVMSWRNAQRLKRIEEALAAREPATPRG